ncbi:MAG TPA: DNA polymerase III subunit alpha, partial [Planctomycetes bacterium]|nr:DNA polymerase III subunit alpha [Planctomycetota bacterium]
PRQEETNGTLITIAKELGLPLVATNDVHYPEKEDAETHELWLAIGSQKTMNDPNRRRLSSNAYYFRSGDEMVELFSDIPEALANTVSIAERVNTKIEVGVYHFPRFGSGGNGASVDELASNVREGAQKRYGAPLPGPVGERIRKELDVIGRMGFTDYMLIVSDVVAFAREQGIPVGPGRGSAAGSIVCYCLGITDIDPLKYDLLFERFINEGRNEMPDIDLDFAPEGRPRIIRHLEEKYGSDSVRPIIAFSELKAKAAIKDVARALELPPSRPDAVCKFIPSVPAVPLNKALETIPEVKEAYDKDPEMHRVIELAGKLEGLVRQSTVHASGVVIGDKALENYTPLYYNPSTETVTTQYEMKIIERVGLLKIDILGLATLSTVTKTLDIIRSTGREPPDLDNIPLDDEKTFALLGNGRSRGIFQFESEGMRRLLQQARPSNVEDLIALNALYRPGPMQDIDMWVNCKHGRENVRSQHPIVETVLEPTYGVIVYQEQVIRLASEIAGFTLSEADILRKAMGKKNTKLMAMYGRKFVEGAAKKGIDARQAEDIYASMSRFGEYGFNKSHSAAYAVLACRTAYLKAHHPEAFMAALLSIEGDPRKVVQYIDEARTMGIKVLPPDVNESEKDFTVVESGVRFGLAAVKGLGEKASDVIIEARRSAGRFTDFYDFVERVDLRLVNKQVITTLIKSGALDSLGIRRSQAMLVTEDAVAYTAGRQAAINRGQTSLFGAEDSHKAAMRPPIPDVPEWPDRKLLEGEKEVLGFYVSSHPMLAHAQETRQFVSKTLAELEDVSDGQELVLAGIVVELSVKRSRRSGELWAAVTIEDLEGRIEAVVYPSVYAECRSVLESDKLVYMRGRAKVEEAGVKLMADEVFSSDEAPGRLYGRIDIILPDDPDGKLERVKELIHAFPGAVPVRFEIRENGQKIFIQAGDAFKVNPVSEFVESIERTLGPGSIRRLNGSPGRTNAAPARRQNGAPYRSRHR